MQMIINGKTEHLEPGLSIAGFLADNALDPEAVVVELNGSIIESAQYGETVLEEDDRLEVLCFVGGG